MSKTKVRQKTQIRKSDTYDDTLPAGATLETSSASGEDDLNALRSQINKIIGQTNWFDAPNNSLEDIGPGADGNELVKVSANDTTAGYLEAKIVAGAGISISTLNDGGDEDLQISATGGTGDVVGPVSSTDTAIARWDGATGELLQDSGVYVSDSDQMTSLKELVFEEPYETIVAGSPTNIDWTNGTLQRLYLTQNVSLTFTAPTAPPVGAESRGAVLTLRIVQSGLGGFTVTWPGTVYGAEPTLNPLTGESNSTVVQLLFEGTTAFPSYFFLSRGGAGTPGEDLWWGPYGLSYDMWNTKDAKFLWRARVDLLAKDWFGAIGQTVPISNSDAVRFLGDASSRHHDVHTYQLVSKAPYWETAGPAVRFNGGITENYGTWEVSNTDDFAFIYNATTFAPPYTTFAVLARLKFQDDPTLGVHVVLDNTYDAGAGFMLACIGGDLVFTVQTAVPAVACQVSTPVTWAAGDIVDIAVVRDTDGTLRLYVDDMGTVLDSSAYVSAGTSIASGDLILAAVDPGGVEEDLCDMSLYGLVMLGEAPDQADREMWFQWIGGVDFSDAPSIATGAAGLSLLDWSPDRLGYMIKLDLPILRAAPDDDATQAYEVDLGTSWTVL